MIGYTSKSVTVGNQSTLKVVLDVDSRQLQEVVVTALGIKKDIRRIGVAMIEGLVLLKRTGKGVEHFVCSQGGGQRKVTARETFCEAEKIGLNPVRGTNIS